MSLQSEYLEKAYHYRDVRPKRKLLGTFGFRGVVDETITGDMAERFGAALARYLQSKDEDALFSPGEGPEPAGDDGPAGDAGTSEAGPPGRKEGRIPRRRVVLAKDVRTSSDMLASALISGLTKNGVDTLELGLLSPGGLSREILIKNAHAGVIITASHNPPQYNGIKVMNGAGRGFTPDQDLELESFYFRNDDPVPAANGRNGAMERVGELKSFPAALDEYADSIVEFATGLYPTGTGLKVVVDGGGGNASKVTPRVLREFGCDVVEYNCDYDGEFTLRPSEPTARSLSRLSELVVENGADFGVAHDGDSDRTNFVNGEGRFIQGDRTATMFLVELFEKLRSRGLTEPVIPVNVAFSRILEDVSSAHGFEVLYTPVGEPSIAEAMDRYGAALGAEEMGSLIIRDWSWSREGPVLAPLLAGILCEKGMSLAELDATYPRYFQKKSAMEVDREAFDRVKGTVAERLGEMDLEARSVMDFDGVKVMMDDGWLLIRTSGTEPKFRVFSESKDEGRMEELNRRGLDLLKECME
jgi:phosphomannomutase